MTTEKNEEVQVEDRKARDYELTFIVAPAVESEALEAIVENVSQYVTGKGGSITSVDHWGKRRLAYPIRHVLEGHYILARFKMRPEFSKQLEVNLEISEDILRHMLIRLDS